jgi:hypothetical protein
MGIPRNLTAMVVMDEPHAGSIYGGTLAAPVFQKIMERSFRFISTRNELGAYPQRSPNYIEPKELFDVKGEDLIPASFTK